MRIVWLQNFEINSTLYCSKNALIFVAFDTNKCSHRKMLVTSLAVCSTMYCIPHVSGGVTGCQLFQTGTSVLILWGQQKLFCMQMAFLPQDHLWEMWRQFVSLFSLVYTAVFCVRIILLGVCIHTEVYNCWNWGSWSKNTPCCGKL